MQAISSAGTSVKQVPAILNKIIQVMTHPHAYLASIGDVLDMGGGKYDLLTNVLSKLAIRNWIYDPYNRSVEHNKFVLDMLTTRGADMVLCSNVLNVIREPKARAHMHGIIKRCARHSGKVFFTVYEGDGSSRGKVTTKGWQANRPAGSYVRELRKFYSYVRLCGNGLIICEGFK